MKKIANILTGTLIVLLTACTPKVELHDVYTGMKYEDFIKVHPQNQCIKEHEFSCEVMNKDHKLTVNFNGDEKIYLAEDKWHTSELSQDQVIEIYSEKYGQVKDENKNYKLFLQSIWWCFGKNCESKRTVTTMSTGGSEIDCYVYGYPDGCKKSQVLVKAEITSEDLSKKVWYNKQLKDVGKAK